MKRVHSLFLSAVLLSGLCALAQQQEPALGDVVRQSKPAKKASRVITNEDIPSRPQQEKAPASSVAAKTTPAAASAPEQPLTQEKADVKPTPPANEDSEEVTAMKQRLKQLDGDLKDLSAQASRAEELAKAEKDPDRRDVLEHVAEKQRESLARSKAEQSGLNKKLEEQQKKSEQK